MPVRLGDLVVLEDRPQAVVRGEVIDLRPIEHRLLMHFATHPSRVWTRAELYRDVWGAEPSNGSRSVDVVMARLRRSLHGAGHALRTVRRVGYRLDPERLSSVRDG